MRHKVSTIQPTEYQMVLCYALPSIHNKMMVAPVNLDRIDALRASGAKMIGFPGVCTVCGAAHTYGDLWKHVPTSEYIFVGHICASKYGLIADRQEFESTIKGMRVRTAREHEREMRFERAYNFSEENCADLTNVWETTQNAILQNMWFYLLRTGRLSEAQIEFARKLAFPEPDREENWTDVPLTGKRQTVEGEVISVKFRENAYGGALKMTVRVTEENGGEWLAWGSVPQALIDAGRGVKGVHADEALKGCIVKFDAALKLGDKPYFAFTSRPSKATVISWPE